ncbi:MAG: hypothetical protein C5B59_17170 [Bacteroidetes bacterium]|nr:MAG: hypothetical protein C5B59_17170 [Bacteroidota bacterium]
MPYLPVSCQQDRNPLNRHSAGRRLLSPCEKQASDIFTRHLLIHSGLSRSSGFHAKVYRTTPVHSQFKLFLLLVLSLSFAAVQAQTPSPLPSDTLPPPAKQQDTSRVPYRYPFIVGEIFIKGNRITRSYIITRELPFKKGDTLYIQDLVGTFKHAKERIINTRLFNDVVIAVKEFRGFVVDIEIQVKERWYIFPLPYVRPVDRNFTAWAQHNYSLSRLDFGVKYSHYNFTGRNDYLRAWLITGYSNQVELAYDLPYVGRTLKHGFGVGFFYNGFKEINAATINNQQYFMNSDTIPYAGKYMREQLSFSLRYYYRPALKIRHAFRLGYNRLNIDSSVTIVNPHYFNNNKTQIFYPEFNYALTYNNIDYVPYPLNGFYLQTGFTRKGINSDMNLWQLTAKTYQGFPLWRKTYFVTQNLGLISLPFKQPFYNQQFVGYGDYYMRGFEKYVVDGVFGGLSRNTLLRELFNFNIPFLRGTSHDVIPIRIYAKTYVDFGYVDNKYFRDNSLVNKFLYSGGLGVDVVTFYDFVFRFEYSINQLGEKGFYFHIRNDF